MNCPWGDFVSVGHFNRFCFSLTHLPPFPHLGTAAYHIVLQLGTSPPPPHLGLHSFAFLFHKHTHTHVCVKILNPLVAPTSLFFGDNFLLFCPVRSSATAKYPLLARTCFFLRHDATDKFFERLFNGFYFAQHSGCTLIRYRLYVGWHFHISCYVTQLFVVGLNNCMPIGLHSTLLISGH